MGRSHVLLLLAEDQPLMIPGKVYDYLSAGSDILAITRSGATADLLHKTGTGIVLPPDDHQKLKETINALYHKYLTAGQHNKNFSSVRNGPPPRYSQRRLASELAGLLEKTNYGFRKVS